MATLLQILRNPILKIYVLDNNWNLFCHYLETFHPGKSTFFFWNFMRFLIVERRGLHHYTYTESHWKEVEEMLFFYFPDYIAYCSLKSTDHFSHISTGCLTVTINIAHKSLPHEIRAL